MKIMKIFGVVLALHAFVLIVIFVNPGCSSPSRPSPSDSAPSASAPLISPTAPAINMPAVQSGFDPDAPAVAGGSSRYSPTRPGTPVATALATPLQPPADVTPAKSYTVVNGDSLWKIAQTNNITYQELAAANGLPTDAKLRTGQKLVIPAPKVGATVAAMPATGAAGVAVASTKAGPNPSTTKAGTPAQQAKVAASGALKHTVQPGETLSSIAQKYKVSAGDLAAENNLTNRNLIRPGMELTIPGFTEVAKPAGADAKQQPPRATGAPAPMDSNMRTASPTDIPVIKVDH